MCRLSSGRRVRDRSSTDSWPRSIEWPSSCDSNRGVQVTTELNSRISSESYTTFTETVSFAGTRTL